MNKRNTPTSKQTHASGGSRVAAPDVQSYPKIAPPEPRVACATFQYDSAHRMFRIMGTRPVGQLDFGPNHSII